MHILLVGNETVWAEGLCEEGFAVESISKPEWDSEEDLPSAEAVVVIKPREWSLVVRLRELGFRGGILVVAENLNAEDRIAAFNAGADDVWTAPASLAELSARLRAFQRRPTGWQETALREGPLEMDLLKRIALREGRPLKLTKTEFDLLVTFVRRRDEILSAQTLSDLLGSGKMSPNTLSAHLRNLRAKIDVSGKPSLVRTERGCGYILASARCCRD